MRSKPEPEKWRSIDPSSEYAGGFVYQRIQWLIDYDPFVGMFNDNAKQGLSALIVEALGNTSLATSDQRKIVGLVNDALDKSAFGLMLSHQCRAQIMILVDTAVHAGSVDNGEPLR